MSDSGARQQEVSLSCGPNHAVQFEIKIQIPPGAGTFPVIVRGDLGWGPAPIADEVLRRGYMLVEFDRTQIAKDEAGRENAIYDLCPEADGGALAMWAWAYHRVVDYLLTRPDVKASQIAITGHSRGGKAVLLAGALDERIALTAPHQSGTGGASPYRLQGEKNESLQNILKSFPYWFHPALHAYIGREEELPFDQHFAMSLVAPRALFLNNGLEDQWGNPLGAYHTTLAAREVYQFLGATPLVGIHFRDGGHAHNADDWRALLDFADQQFKAVETATDFSGGPFAEVSPGFDWRVPQA